jgi:hypothetical protein
MSDRYGGSYEVGDRCVTLSDLYYLDVTKNDRYCMFIHSILLSFLLFY